MTKKTKTILGVLALGYIAFYLYKRKQSGKPLLPFGNFSGDDNFFNVIGKYPQSCTVHAGSTNASVGTILDGGRIIVQNKPNTIICPISNTPSGLPVQG
jgi:hypothetical protein